MLSNGSSLEANQTIKEQWTKISKTKEQINKHIYDYQQKQYLKNDCCVCNFTQSSIIIDCHKTR